MNIHHIRDMAKELVDAGVCPVDQKDWAIQVLSQYWQGYCVLIWLKDEIIDAANDRGITLTESQATEVVNHLEDNHDASVGVNWKTIDDATDEIVAISWVRTDKRKYRDDN